MIIPISTRAAFFRPMYWETIPRGKRISAPAMTGTAIMTPFWEASNPNSAEMKGAMAPLSTQMAKQKSK